MIQISSICLPSVLEMGCCTLVPRRESSMLFGLLILFFVTLAIAGGVLL